MKVRVFEQANKIGFSCFLESSNSRGLETKVSLEVLGDLSHESLERKFSNEELSGLLIFSDFSKSYSSRSESVRFLKISERRLVVFTFTPPPVTADFLAALVATCFLGAFPPVDLRAVCLVLAMCLTRYGFLENDFQLETWDARAWKENTN